MENISQIRKRKHGVTSLEELTARERLPQLDAMSTSCTESEVDYQLQRSTDQVRLTSALFKSCVC